LSTDAEADRGGGLRGPARERRDVLLPRHVRRVAAAGPPQPERPVAAHGGRAPNGRDALLPRAGAERAARPDEGAEQNTPDRGGQRAPRADLRSVGGAGERRRDLSRRRRG